MSRHMPKPHRKKNGLWRGQVTLKNGKRPAKDFHTYAEANAWIADMLANNNADNAPILGGPTQARLADMLDYYVRNVTVAKEGAVQEINRANHYLSATELPELALWENADGQKEIVTLAEKHARKRKARGDNTTTAPPQKRQGTRNEAGVTPEGFAQHNNARGRQAHPRTYELYAALANKRASQITGADMKSLHSTMTAERYAASTIQKEIALLKALFNETENWNWPTIKNPCLGIKLKQGNQRFVVFTDDQRERLVDALKECDNPQFWPLVEFSIEAALRQISMLRLKWEDISLEDSKVRTFAKGVVSYIPLSPRAITILEGLPGPRQGLVFTTTADAIRKSWARVREKAGLPKLLFRDLRHIAPTILARAGMNAFFLRDVLGHKTTTQADIYINLANQDVVDALRRLAPEVGTPLPPSSSDWESLQAENKARRLNKTPIVLVEHDDDVAASTAQAPMPDEPPPEPASVASNVVAFRPRAVATGQAGPVTEERLFAQKNGS